LSVPLRLLRFGLLLALVLGLVGGTLLRATAQTTPEGAVLDGAAPIDDQAVADLAIARATLGASWLAAVMRDDGAFYYGYEPSEDEYIADEYNEVRHAGTTYAMYTAYGATGDGTILAAAEQATGWITKFSLEVPGSGRAFISSDNGVSKLGGQGLALVALLERRRVSGNTDADELIAGLGSFLLSMETDVPGSYFMSYNFLDQQRLMTPDVEFYPGEALLALTRLAQQFPDGPYLDAAIRAANYLVYQRDGDLPALGTVPRDDHWLAIALAELYRLRPDEGYRSVVYLQAERMISNQYTADDGLAERIGGAKTDGVINFTSTATKGEAIVAAWALATNLQDSEAVARFATGARRNAQFQMRVQYMPENSQLYPQPERLHGGWPGSATDRSIRIDYVQHNMSVLLGLWSLTKYGDIPIAHPL